MKYGKTVWFVLFLVLFACGVYGFVVHEGYDLVNSLYFTTTLFFYNSDLYTSSVLINVSRFGAVLLTTTFILSAFKKVADGLTDYIKDKLFKTVFVYGNNELVREFKESTDNRVINRDYFVEADKYVLLDSDEKNLSFYNENLKKLTNKEVFIKNEDFSNTIHGKHRFFSLNQIAARKFWKDNSLIDIAFENGKAIEELNIVFAGFNNLAEDILFESLMVNIYDAKQKVNYHIFSDDNEFEYSHLNSKELNIHYYHDSFMNHKDVLDASSVILFFKGERELNNLIGCRNGRRIIYFSDDVMDKDFYLNHRYGNNRNTLMIFNYYKDTCVEEEIIDEISLRDAKRLNSNYNDKNGFYSDESMDEQWMKLTSFHKLVNITCVDYYKFTTVKLLEQMYNCDYKDISDEQLEAKIDILSELEHIRWCNYHYFCNWQYSDVTSKPDKLHNCLVPYEKLSVTEKNKDAEQIRCVRQLYR